MVKIVMVRHWMQFVKIIQEDLWCLMKENDLYTNCSRLSFLRTILIHGNIYFYSNLLLNEASYLTNNDSNTQVSCASYEYLFPDPTVLLFL